MNTTSHNNTLFTSIAIVFCLYASVYIFRTSFVIDGERFFSLFDDAMISMRYAKNLAEGHGLVWNAGGERIEGYTNFLWVVYMALLHLLPVPTSKISLLVQISAAVFLVINLWVISKIAGLVSNGSRLVVGAALVLTAFYLPLNTWSLQGMEVSVLTLVVSTAVWLAFKQMACHKPLLPLLYGLLGMSMLVRMDMTVPYMVILCFLLVADPAHRKKHVTWGVGILLLFLLGQTLFRLLYFGDALPNTYYLKLTGYPTPLRISRGLYVFLQFVGAMNWMLFLIPFMYVWYRRGDKRVALLLVLFVGQGLYSIYVGGDAWEWWGGSNRYLCIAMPQFFTLLSVASAALVGTLAGSSTTTSVAKQLLGVGAVLVCVLSTNMLTAPGTIKQLLLIDEPLHVRDNETVVRDAFRIAAMTTKQARVAVVWAGASAYYADRVMIDLLGKCDRVVAHRPMHQLLTLNRFTWFYPGHLKWDYGYSIGQLNPDVVYQLWMAPETAMPYLQRDYVKVSIRENHALYLRKGSQNVLWDLVAFPEP
jgi:hypothetical protein